MIWAIPFPDISPEIFAVDIGGFTFALRWYAMAYVLGIIAGWRLAVMAAKRPALWPGGTSPMTPHMIEELMTTVILGIVIGGRLGFVLFYQPAYYFANPVEIPMIWQGGMSFHGGMLGVAIGGLIFAWRRGVPMLSMLDIMALATPPGLLLGRVANFINGELWGGPPTCHGVSSFPVSVRRTAPVSKGPARAIPRSFTRPGSKGWCWAAC